MDYANLPYYVLAAALLGYMLYGVIDQIRLEREAKASLFSGFDALAAAYHQTEVVLSSKVALQAMDGPKQLPRFDSETPLGNELRILHAALPLDQSEDTAGQREVRRAIETLVTALQAYSDAKR